MFGTYKSSSRIHLGS